MGVRIGEAEHPGPPDAHRPPSPLLGATLPANPAPSTPSVLCLTVGRGTCPGRPAGLHTLQCGRTSMTIVPAHSADCVFEYLAAHHLDACSVCGLLVDRRFYGVHPRCRPTQRASVRRTSREGADPSLPSLDKITSTFVPTLRHVPHAARASWAQCLAQAVSSAASLNTVAAWQQLLMLPKAVLGAPSRGAGKRRCQRWLDGERGELWDELDSARRPAKAGVPSLEARHARCCLLAAEGELSRAAALVEPTPLPPSAETFTQLQDKRPQAALPNLPCWVPAPDFEVLLALCAALSALQPQAPLACARTTCEALQKLRTQMRSLRILPCFPTRVLPCTLCLKQPGGSAPSRSGRFFDALLASCFVRPCVRRPANAYDLCRWVSVLRRGEAAVHTTNQAVGVAPCLLPRPRSGQGGLPKCLQLCQPGCRPCAGQGTCACHCVLG